MGDSFYDGVIVGAGPGGLATLAALLDAGLSKILWVDVTFEGGRLNQLYREISSNTKTGIYLDAVYSSGACRSVIASTPAPNAITRLETMDRDSTCQLSLAGDMICMLRDGFFRRPEVEHIKGMVDTMSLDGDLWTVSASCGRVTTRRVFLCTGSHPKPATLHLPFNPKLKVLDLDECMRRSHIPTMFPRDSKSVVAVIGNSHSGILCCQNLYEFSQCNKRILKVFNFRRRPIRYAKYTKRGIVFDNSGLKGRTAEWAKTVMESEPDPDMLEEIDSGKDQDSVFRKYLPQCTHIVYAIGYISSPWPKIYVEGRQRQEELEFDMQTSGFHFTDKSARVPGLYGNGIAFPEQVKDPEGNIEAAVGIAKFFSFAERTKESWLYVQ